MKKCIIINCDRDVRPRSKFQECSLCRSMFNRWFRRPTEHLTAYLGKIYKASDRIAHLTTDPRGKKHDRAVRSSRQQARV